MKLVADTKNYKGRWVAVINGRIIAQGGTPDQARRAALVFRPKENPDILYIPIDQMLIYPDLIKNIRDCLSDNRPIYLVGGVVRDSLLGKKSKDIDIVLAENAIPLARKVADQLGGSFFPLKASFDTGRVIIKDNLGERTIVDFTGMRGENLEADLQARDFTINAIAAEIHHPENLLDPLGGAVDLLARKLRVCSEDSMQQDPLRILRGIRMAANLQLSIEKETRNLMRLAVPGLDRVSAERKRDELFNILSGSQPAIAIRALDLLGALTKVLPELESLKGLQQTYPHTQDVFNHTLDVVQKLELVLNVLSPSFRTEEELNNFTYGLISLNLGRFREEIAQHIQIQFTPERTLRPLLLFSALYHDIGKAESQNTDKNGHIHFYGHEKIGAEIARKRGEALKLSNEEIERLGKIIMYHMRPLLLTNSEKAPSRRAIYRFYRDADVTGVDICLFSLADFLGTYYTNPPEELWDRHLQTVKLLLSGWWEKSEVNPDPKLFLDGNEIMSLLQIPPGPEVGSIIDKLREAQGIGIISSHQEAIEFIKNEFLRSGDLDLEN